LCLLLQDGSSITLFPHTLFIPSVPYLRPPGLPLSLCCWVQDRCLCRASACPSTFGGQHALLPHAYATRALLVTIKRAAAHTCHVATTNNAACRLLLCSSGLHLPPALLLPLYAAYPTATLPSARCLASFATTTRVLPHRLAATACFHLPAIRHTDLHRRRHACTPSLLV